MILTATVILEEMSFLEMYTSFSKITWVVLNFADLCEFGTVTKVMFIEKVYF